MLLILRLLPFVTALTTGVLFWIQRKEPALYPWICGISILLFCFSVAGIVWGRMTLVDIFEKIVLPFLLQISLVFGLVLVETTISLWIVIISSFVGMALSLELLYLYCFERERYPVNGLSRLNIALVPIIAWYTVSTSVGLLNFLHFPHFIYVFINGILGMILYRTTGHPGATPSQNRIWMGIGLLIGLHVGWIGLHLPLSMPMQGVIAAVLLSGGLRMRRYVYNPKPSRRIALFEGTAIFVLFTVAILTAKWL
ncbi:hypothetical protein IT408_01160 [Candidatus Uhrbacteria bacterium]|nr:hypothetical protein [Candidatus Uhrbacteria bacterium]